MEAMLYTTSVMNIQQGFTETLREVMENGDDVFVRGNKTREIRTMVMNVKEPLNRVICMPHRNNSIFATIAETLWVLAGRNDIAYLSKYLPRAADFSDDGKTWRAGYGPRIRNYDPVTYGIHHGVDQLYENIQLLKIDPSTRRAVISIFDPAHDFADSKDIPCTGWLHTLIRNDRLNTTVAVRSNDVIWGASGINFFEWTVLMELMACCTDTKVGELNYLADSYHVYEKHFERADKIWKSGSVDLYSMGFGNIPIMVKTLSDWDDQLKNLMWAVDIDVLDVDFIEATVKDPFLKECAFMLLIHKHINVENIADSFAIFSVLDNMTRGGDFRVSALEYLSRQKSWTALASHLDITKDENDFLSQFNTV